jgi:hypothetical protein
MSRVLLPRDRSWGLGVPASAGVGGEGNDLGFTSFPRAERGRDEGVGLTSMDLGMVSGGGQGYKHGMI